MFVNDTKVCQKGAFMCTRPSSDANDHQRVTHPPAQTDQPRLAACLYREGRQRGQVIRSQEHVCHSYEDPRQNERDVRHAIETFELGFAARQYNAGPEWMSPMAPLVLPCPVWAYARGMAVRDATSCAPTLGDGRSLRPRAPGRAERSRFEAGE